MDRAAKAAVMSAIEALLKAWQGLVQSGKVVVLCQMSSEVAAVAAVLRYRKMYTTSATAT